MKVSQFFATLLEIPKKINLFNKTLKIILNGEENDYSERVDALINNSITTQTAVEIFVDFITGKGVLELNDVSVNTKKNIKFFKFLNEYNESYGEQKGVAVHVQHKITGLPDRFEVLPFMNVRKGKKDDREYVGKYCYSEHGFSDKVNETAYV